MSGHLGSRPAVRVRQVLISHTPEQGTTLSGTRWRDGLWSMLVTGYLRGCWAWDQAAGLYRCPDSIGQSKPNPEVIRRTERALRNLSVEVVTDLPLT